MTEEKHHPSEISPEALAYHRPLHIYDAIEAVTRLEKNVIGLKVYGPSQSLTKRSDELLRLSKVLMLLRTLEGKG